MSNLTVFHDYAFGRPKAIAANVTGTFHAVKTEYVKSGGIWVPTWTAPGAQIILSSATFTVPAHVWSVCVAAISEGKPGNAGGNADAGGPGSGGDGGDGGSLAWKNNIAVTPGQTFSVYSVAGQVNFGASLYVLHGRDGVSVGWDVSYLGGSAGHGEARYYDFGIGFTGAVGGQAAYWSGAGATGEDAPGTGPRAPGATDLYGLARTYIQPLSGNRSQGAFVGSDGGAYGAGGSGGSGGDYTGTTTGRSGGAGGPGAVRIIWGTGKSFPDNANF